MIEWLDDDDDGDEDEPGEESHCHLLFLDPTYTKILAASQDGLWLVPWARIRWLGLDLQASALETSLEFLGVSSARLIHQATIRYTETTGSGWEKAIPQRYMVFETTVPRPRVKTLSWKPVDRLLKNRKPAFPVQDVVVRTCLKHLRRAM